MAEDLTPDDHEDIAVAMEVAGVGAAPGAIVVRSHIWPPVIGEKYGWVMSIPGTEHEASGVGVSVNDCYDAMNALIAEWYPELMAEQPQGPFLISRIKHDG